MSQSTTETEMKVREVLNKGPLEQTSSEGYDRSTVQFRQRTGASLEVSGCGRAEVHSGLILSLADQPGLILSLADQPGLILSLAAWLEDSEPRGTTSG